MSEQRRYDRSEELLRQALELIPLGAQTFSKSITQYPRGAAPLFMERAEGSRAWDVDGNSYLPDDVLCKVDRASMGVSLETRVPFLDHRVAEVAARIPLSMKIRDGRGKAILCKLLHLYVPRHLVDRPKAGFAVPVGEWLKGPLRGWAEELLDPRSMRADGSFDAGAVGLRWRNHLSGREDATAALWSVLMFQAWLREQRGANAAAA